MGEKDEKEGWVSPAFDNTKDMMAWLHDPSAKYQNGKTANDYKGQKEIP